MENNSSGRAKRAKIATAISGSLVVGNVFTLLNISNSGALIRISQKMTLGELYHLSFDFFRGEQQVNLKLKTKVVRAKLISFGVDSANNKVPVYEVGLCFDDHADDGIKELKQYIALEEMKKAKEQSDKRC